MNSTNELLARISHSNLRAGEAIALHVTADGQGKIASSSGSYYYLRDILGTVVDIANSSGSIVQHYVYSSFGKILDIKDNAGSSILTSAPVKTLHAFANSIFDNELGLYFNNQRYYSADNGRFIQADPHPGYITLPKTMINKYIYSANNPVNFRDPSGANFIEDFVNGLANTIVDAINGIGKALEGFLPALGDLLTSEEFRTAVIVVAAFYTGGLAGGTAGGGFIGAMVGSVVGGITGAAVGAIHATISGDDPHEWMDRGFKIGAVVGGISGYTKGFGLFESSEGLITDTVTTSQSQAVNVMQTSIKKHLACMATGVGVMAAGSLIANFAVDLAPILGVGSAYIAVAGLAVSIGGAAYTYSCF